MKASDRPRILLMFVGVQGESLGSRRDDGEDGRHVLAGRPRVRAAELSLDACATALLRLSPSPAAAKLAVGEPVGEVGVRPGHQVKERGVILAVLEALEAVERDRLFNRKSTRLNSSHGYI